jgi:hypothetical protein
MSHETPPAVVAYCKPGISRLVAASTSTSLTPGAGCGLSGWKGAVVSTGLESEVKRAGLLTNTIMRRLVEPRGASSLLHRVSPRDLEAGNGMEVRPDSFYSVPDGSVPHRHRRQSPAARNPAASAASRVSKTRVQFGQE